MSTDIEVFALFAPSVCRSTMAAAPQLMRSHSAGGDSSPLKHFVVAKKKISDVFEQLLGYVEETSNFVAGEMFWLSSLICDGYIGSHCFEMIGFMTGTLCPSSLCCLVCVCRPETCRNKALYNIASQDQKLEIEAYAEKLAVIKEVLARRHMKVAFFGR